MSLLLRLDRRYVNANSLSCVMTRHDLAATGAALAATARELVDGGPGTPRCLVRAQPAVLVAGFNMLGHALLFIRVARFVASGHNFLFPFLSCALQVLR